MDLSSLCSPSWAKGGTGEDLIPFGILSVSRWGPQKEADPLVQVWDKDISLLRVWSCRGTSQKNLRDTACLSQGGGTAGPTTALSEVSSSGFPSCHGTDSRAGDIDILSV